MPRAFLTPLEVKGRTDILWRLIMSCRDLFIRLAIPVTASVLHMVTSDRVFFVKMYSRAPESNIDASKPLQSPSQTFYTAWNPHGDQVHQGHQVKNSLSLTKL